MLYSVKTTYCVL